ncbi:uncharacterized protein LOC125667202 isoform X2 [Ostrea edulis]|uniref:uncharacterized protein LOC125667202 isoform X2 n=1 Tax=Ostrea edulis TaxID=37623 RepID=UPI0024AEF360|nr:uncharacterized protein LOC125667202 isoform X2 [Ostrea edulis]XP_056021024.1 uncharacterized protein LOC125667202 isoform X2 [Ostrea edulis]
MLKLKFPSADQFHRICSTYVIPTIDKFWSDHRQELLNDFKDKEVVVLGDGRNDSPGHCAQYCSYTLMDNETKKILTIETLDKRMTDRKSVNMEKAGFQIALNDLLEKDIKVVEVVTDAHLGIGSVMKKDYPNIHHSHDIWHVAKNLGKKILKVAQKKGNNILLDWCKDIMNHFWFSCRRAESYEEFMGIWQSVLQHITDTHEWILSHGGVNHCLHGELGEEERTKPWLSPTKHAHVLKDLAAVVLNKRLLNNVGYYLRFRF